jgi:hypothetical protein
MPLYQKAKIIIRKKINKNQSLRERNSLKIDRILSPNEEWHLRLPAQKRRLNKYDVSEIFAGCH